MGRVTKVRLAAGAVLAAAFLAGVALGFLLDRGVIGRSSGPFGSAGAPAPPPSEWIVDRIPMDPEQREAVDSILAHHGTLMAELQREYRPRFLNVVDGANRALRDALTEDQLARYDSLEAELVRRRARGNPAGRR